MTGNQIKGKGFRGALRYNLAKVEKNLAEVLDSSFTRSTENSIMQEVQMVRTLHPRLQKYFYHTSINFPPNENPSNEMMIRIGNDYLTANGFNQHQFIMFRHFDADHPHLHILVNRIGFDGTVLTDSNDYKRSETVLRDLEIKYNLTRVNSSKQAQERAITKNELEMMKRTNDPSHKIKLQVIIKGLLKSAQNLTIAQFIDALEIKGIRPRFNQASTGYVSGISYEFDRFVITGAKLGNEFKWPSIKNKIDYEQERDRRAIHEANTRSGILTNISGPRTGPSNGEGDRIASKENSTRVDPLRAASATSGKHYSGSAEKNRINKSNNSASTSTDPNQQKSDNFNLASLLDNHRNGDLSGVDHEPDLVDKNLIRKRRRKKRRRPG